MTGAAAALYVALLGYSGDSRGPAAFARVGSAFINRAQSSPAIEHFAGNVVAPVGYDGQFFLYIAADPTNAADYLDDPGYRYGRILYPIVARVLAFGDLRLLPAALLAVNLIAVLAATYALALYFERRGASAWWALVFAAFPGMWIGVYFDLSEPFAYALAAVAMTQLTRRPVVAAALLAAGALTRETVILFAIAAVFVIARESWRRALWFGAAAIAPLVVWRLTLLAWLGDWGNSTAGQFEHVPFGGAVGQDRLMILAIAVPAIAALAIVAAQRELSVEALALLLNVLALVIFLPRGSWGGYIATGRISTAVVLSFLLCIPRLGARRLALLPVTLWILGWDLATTGNPR